MQKYLCNVITGFLIILHYHVCKITSVEALSPKISVPGGYLNHSQGESHAWRVLLALSSSPVHHGVWRLLWNLVILSGDCHIF